MSRYCGIGRVIRSTHPKIKPGALMAVALDRHYDDPYPMFLLHKAEDGTEKLVSVELVWVEFHRFPVGLTQEEKDRLMEKWLNEAIERERQQQSLLKWVNLEEVKA